MTEVWLAFLAGFVGSTHCLGMCGGIVAALALVNRQHSGGIRVVSQALYNLGRITTYTILGAAAGQIGPSITLLTTASSMFWFFCAANLLVIFIGLASACRWPRFHSSSLESAAGRFLALPVKYLASTGSISSAFCSFPLGLVLGLIPCGLVYGPLAVAVASGSPLRGSMIMAALGLGTMPVMLAFGSISSALSGVVRDRMVRLAGLIVAGMGAWGLWRLLSKTCCMH